MKWHNLKGISLILLNLLMRQFAHVKHSPSIKWINEGVELFCILQALQ